jgi:hypothetical protein
MLRPSGTVRPKPRNSSAVVVMANAAVDAVGAAVGTAATKLAVTAADHVVMAAADGIAAAAKAQRRRSNAQHPSIMAHVQAGTEVATMQAAGNGAAAARIVVVGTAATMTAAGIAAAP